MSAALIRGAAQSVRATTASGATPATRLVTGTALHQATNSVAHQASCTASRGLTTSTLLNKAVSETVKDAARAVDQTASDAALKGVELSEGAAQKMKQAGMSTTEASTNATESVSKDTAENIKEQVSGGAQDSEGVASEIIKKAKDTVDGVGLVFKNY